MNSVTFELRATRRPCRRCRQRRDLVLDVSDLRAGYGHVPVLHGVSLAVHDGRSVGIVGHNGMGKTTLLKTLIGLLPATAGRISLDGVDVTRDAGARAQPPGHRLRAAGPRHPAGPERARQPAPGLDAPTPSETEQRRRSSACSTLFPRLDALLDRRGGALSGGEQQILALARALVAEPVAAAARRADAKASSRRSSRRSARRWPALRTRRRAVDDGRRAEPRPRARRGRPHRRARERPHRARDAAPSGLRGGELADDARPGRRRACTRSRRAARARRGRATPPAPAPQRQPSRPAAPSIAAPGHRRAHDAARSTRTPPRRPAPPPPAPRRPHHQGTPWQPSNVPPLDQMKDIVASLHMSMSEREVARVPRRHGGHAAGLRPARRSCPTTCRRCAIRARPATGPAPPRTRSTPGP